MNPLTKYTIEVHARTHEDAEGALEQIAAKIRAGFRLAILYPYDANGNGYCFASEVLPEPELPATNGGAS